MDLSQSSVAALYLMSFLLGAALGLFYDGLRMVRILFGEHFSRRAVEMLQKRNLPGSRPKQRSPRKRNAALVFLFLGDFLFCILAAVSLILLFYERNSGIVRPLAILCSAVGFFLYRATLGKLVMLFSEVIVFAVRYAVGQLIFWMLFPIRKLGGMLRRRMKQILEDRREKNRKRQRKRYTASCFAEARATACGLLPQNERIGSIGKDGQNAGFCKKHTGKEKKQKTAV